MIYAFCHCGVLIVSISIFSTMQQSHKIANLIPGRISHYCMVLLRLGLEVIILFQQKGSLCTLIEKLQWNTLDIRFMVKNMVDSQEYALQDLDVPVPLLLLRLELYWLNYYLYIRVQISALCTFNFTFDFFLHAYCLF